MTQSIHALFQQQFGVPAHATGSAFARVNLIGEHIDYNAGMVLPAPINRMVKVAIAQVDSNAEQKDKIYSQVFQQQVSLALDSHATRHWSDYVAGALASARASGLLNGAVQIAIQSDIPFGAGVSSSAAVTIATFRAIENMTNKRLDKADLALRAQAVENDYIGVPCGIMDQMVVSVAELGYALALDTHSLDYTVIDLPTSHHFAVLFSGVTRHLDEGRYLQRRQQCEHAAALLKVPYLCTMSESQSQAIAQLPAPFDRRARHAYTEHARVLQTIDALQANDLPRVGELMNASHASMRDDFEITTPEVDAVVASAREFGALGARMTGGGFGGCIVACLERNQVTQWQQQMQARHPQSEFIC